MVVLAKTDMLLQGKVVLAEDVHISFVIGAFSLKPGHETQSTDLRKSEYSYPQTMPSSSAGIFPFSQTGPSTDPSGSVWDTTTVEGPQNFFADQGDSEEYSFTMGQFPGRIHMDTVDNFQSTWMPAAAAAGGDKTHKAEPMRRISSRGSTTGNRISKISTNKSRSRLPSAVSRGALQAAGFEMIGNTSAVPAGPQGNGRVADPSQFMFHSPVGLTTSPEMLYSSMDGLSGATSVFHDFVGPQHVDPSTIPLDFETSLSGGSPAETWDNLSEVTTPPREDGWALNVDQSPITSVASNSPPIRALDNFTLGGPAMPPMMAAGDLEISMPTAVGDEHVVLGNWATPPLSEGENARDHPLYRSAFPQTDGLYHCPWEGQASCNHKPEKLKCNYE